MTEHTPTPDADISNEQIVAGLTRRDLAGWTRRDVMEAAAVLLSQVHDVDVHHYSDGPPAWLYDQPTEDAAQTVLALTDHLTTTAQAAATAVRASLARRDWLLTGRPLRCLACDEGIDPTLEERRVCRGAAEHAVCHLEDTKAEDADRAFTVTEAERAAHLEERNRTGGPRPNDLVDLIYPDGHTIEAIWEATPDGRGAARANEYRGGLIDLADVVRIEILDLAEDAGTTLPDGHPVDYTWIRAAAPCAACQRPLAEAPAVWDAGYVVHQHCIPPTSQPLDPQ